MKSKKNRKNVSTCFQPTPFISTFLKSDFFSLLAHTAHLIKLNLFFFLLLIIPMLDWKNVRTEYLNDNLNLMTWEFVTMRALLFSSSLFSYVLLPSVPHYKLIMDSSCQSSILNLDLSYLTSLPYYLPHYHYHHHSYSFSIWTHTRTFLSISTMSIL